MPVCALFNNHSSNLPCKEADTACRGYFPVSGNLAAKPEPSASSVNPHTWPVSRRLTTDQGEAGHGGGVLRQLPLVQVGAPDADPVAALQAQRQESVRQPLRLPSGHVRSGQVRSG